MGEVRVVFVEKKSGPAQLVCAAELHFDVGPLAGLKLEGFTVWQQPGGHTYVTGPTRAFGVGDRRKFYDLVRSQRLNDWAPVRALKAWVLDEFEKRAREDHKAEDHRG